MRQRRAEPVSHAGAGVYYGAAVTEGPAFKGRRVCVIGGGNSAGQGAMYLARYATEVQIVVRREDLRSTMSQYLIDQITSTPNIRCRVRTELERVEGNGHVERVVLKSLDEGTSQVEEADALFVFIGTRPRSDWLPPDVLRDSRGFVLTGRDLMQADLYVRLHALATRCTLRGRLPKRWKRPMKRTSFIAT